MRIPPIFLSGIKAGIIKISVAAIIPMNIAIPPNLGMGLQCTLLSSFGISMAPIFGASQMASGVNKSTNTKDVRKDAHKTK